MNGAIALFSSTPPNTPTRYKMTATLWIHRCSGPDLLVRLPTAHDAYNLGARFLFAYQSPVEEENFIDTWNESKYTEDEIFHVGDTPSLQLSVHPGEFHPEDDEYLGISDWADTIHVVTAEEAMALGEDGVPEHARADHEVNTPPPENQVRESAFAEATTRYAIPRGIMAEIGEDDESVDEDWRQTQIEMYRYGSDR